MTRRNFLKNSAYLAFSLNILPKISLANLLPEQKNNHFVFYIIADGGMDVSLGLDPQIHSKKIDQNDIFISYRPEDIIIKSNLRFAPAAKALANHYKDIAVVNGINMRTDLGHESLLKYIRTGSTDFQMPELSVRYQKHMQNDSKIFGLLSNTNIFSGSENFVTTGAYEAISFDFNKLSMLASANTEGEFKSIFTGLNKNSEQISRTLSQFKEQIRGTEIEGAEDNLENIIHTTTLRSIKYAFLNELSSSALLNFSQIEYLDLDTHDDHETKHPIAQEKFWQAVSEVFKDFKSTPYGDSSLFEHTTFVVLSEFSRTPFLNSQKGKDHNPNTNSILLAGKGVQGDQTIGASHVISRNNTATGEALHIGSIYDFESHKIVNSRNEMSENSGIIFPENVVASIATILGIDSSVYKLKNAKSAKILSKLVAKK